VAHATGARAAWGLHGRAQLVCAAWHGAHQLTSGSNMTRSAANPSTGLGLCATTPRAQRRGRERGPHRSGPRLGGGAQYRGGQMDSKRKKSPNPRLVPDLHEDDTRVRSTVEKHSSDMRRGGWLSPVVVVGGRKMRR
jgi:hypothetical protein